MFSAVLVLMFHVGGLLIDIRLLQMVNPTDYVFSIFTKEFISPSKVGLTIYVYILQWLFGTQSHSPVIFPFFSVQFCCCWIYWMVKIWRMQLKYFNFLKCIFFMYINLVYHWLNWGENCWNQVSRRPFIQVKLTIFTNIWM